MSDTPLFDAAGLDGLFPDVETISTTPRDEIRFAARDAYQLAVDAAVVDIETGRRPSEAELATPAERRAMFDGFGW